VVNGLGRNVPALCRAIVQGCCRGLRIIEIFAAEPNMTQEELDLLAGALGLDGELPVLRSLWINFGKTPGLRSHHFKLLFRSKYFV
jgi:hypothetical protein